MTIMNSRKFSFTTLLIKHLV